MTSIDERTKQLAVKKICRFCLSQNLEKLSGIYARGVQTTEDVPLPVQVMACASIEPFEDDGMPSWICSDCRLLFNHSYRFKKMCKSAEMLLRQFPLTGEWPTELSKPIIPLDLLPVSAQATLKKAAQQAKHQQQQQQKQQQQQQLQQQQQQRQLQTAKSKQTLTKTRAALPAPPPPPAATRQIPLKPQYVAVGDGGDDDGVVRIGPKKLLNSNPVSSPEPPAPVRMKKEKLDEETNIFLNKVENNEELSIDDVQRLIAAADHETEFIDVDDVQVVQAVAAAAATTTTTTTTTPKLLTKPKTSATTAGSAKKPKVLNKSSIRILNKEAQLDVEPRLSQPKVKRDEDGNVAIVTEILDPSVPYEAEPDPIKNAEHVETNVFPCPHCERSFPLRQLRDIHMVNHNRERGFQCPECDRSFFSKYDLQKHNLIHTGDRPFKCTICEKDFTRATLLHRHEKTHTDIPKSICIYCEKPFISKDEMEKHMERHRKNRPYQCKECKKAFAFKQGLERHELLHSSDQPYPCQYCDLSFSTPNKLARHLTAHAGTRPYPCKFCTKSFLLSHHLTRHMRSHKQGTDVVYSCTDCEKTYKTRDELIYHSAVHATVTLVCPLCKEKFNDIKEVTAHIKDHAEGDSYACEFCDSIFMTAERLLQHTDEEHVDDMAVYLEDEKEHVQKTEQQRATEADAVTVANAKATNMYHEEAEEEEEANDLETMEEFLIDELPAGVHILEDQVIQDGAIKLEISQPSTSKQSPQVLSQLIYRTQVTGRDQSIGEGDEENFMLLPEDNVLVANEAEQHLAEGEFENQMTEEALDEDDYESDEMPIAQPPAKTRRIAAKTVQQSLVIAAAQKPKQQQQLLRRKVAVPPPATSTSGGQQRIPSIKIGTNATNSKSSANINSVLNSLPKSLSVRRNVPAVVAAATLPTATAADAARPARIQQQRLARNAPRRSNNSVEEEQQQKQEQLQIINKHSPVTCKQAVTYSTGATKKSPNQAAAAAAVKTGCGGTQKKLKLQKVVISKAKAAEMAKDGRILIKDGNMIIKPNTPKATSK